MKTSFGLSVNRVARRAAFTLIELLTVMAIILVLAGLIINVAGSANYNSAKARAKGEVSAMSVALESYKTDNGTYPLDPNTPADPTASLNSLLNPQSDTDPASGASAPKYKINSEYLYQVLSGFPVSVGTSPSTSASMSKTYMAFKPAQLQAVTSGGTVSTTNPKMYVVDPFGFCYGYSTICSQYMSQQTAAGTNVPNTKYGYNPTFDLWSTGGYATGGKSTPTSSPSGMTAASFYSSLWITNW